MEEMLRWTKPSSEVDVLFIDDEPADIQLPSGVDLEVTAGRPGAARRHASRAAARSRRRSRPARRIQVPLFVEVGERIRVDTRSGEYVSRA